MRTGSQRFGHGLSNWGDQLHQLRLPIAHFWGKKQIEPDPKTLIGDGFGQVCSNQFLFKMADYCIFLK
jgi:hypothetical protein